jgi:O-antigen/teichoic acid export membrane protein
MKLINCGASLAHRLTRGAESVQSAKDAPVGGPRVPVNRRISHDAIAVFGSRSIVSLFGVVGGIILARTLGPHDRGILAVVLLLPSTLMTVSKFGITQANVYCVRRVGVSAEKVASNSLVLALTLGIGIGAAAWLSRNALLTTVMREVPTWALLLALWLLPLFLIDNYFNGVLQACGNFSVYNRRLVAGGFMIFVLVVGLRLARRLTLATAVLIYIVVNTVNVALLLMQTRWLVRFNLRPHWALLRQQVHFGAKSYVQILAMHLLFRIDVYMVAYYLDPAQIAFYSLALHFTEMILEIPQAVGWVVYPRMASLQKEDVHRLTAQACRRTMCLTGIGALAVVLAGPFIVPLWYGNAFAPASRPLVFATPGMVMMSVFAIVTRDFTSRNNQIVNIRAGMAALISNVLLNVFMIPAMGIVGAALATSISYSLAAFMVMVPYRRESGVAFSELLVPKAEDFRFMWDVSWKTLKLYALRITAPLRRGLAVGS